MDESEWTGDCSSLLANNVKSNQSSNISKKWESETDTGDILDGKESIRNSLIDKSTGCSSVEQDSALLERLFGDSTMSPISVRRDSYEICSSAEVSNERSKNGTSSSLEHHAVLALHVCGQNGYHEGVHDKMTGTFPVDDKGSIDRNVNLRGKSVCVFRPVERPDSDCSVSSSHPIPSVAEGLCIHPKVIDIEAEHNQVSMPEFFSDMVRNESAGPFLGADIRSVNTNGVERAECESSEMSQHQSSVVNESQYESQLSVDNVIDFESQDDRDLMSVRSSPTTSGSVEVTADKTDGVEPDLVDPWETPQSPQPDSGAVTGLLPTGTSSGHSNDSEPQHERVCASFNSFSELLNESARCAISVEDNSANKTHMDPDKNYFTLTPQLRQPGNLTEVCPAGTDQIIEFEAHDEMVGVSAHSSSTVLNESAVLVRGIDITSAKTTDIELVEHGSTLTPQGQKSSKGTGMFSAGADSVHALGAQNERANATLHSLSKEPNESAVEDGSTKKTDFEPVQNVLSKSPQLWQPHLRAVPYVCPTIIDPCIQVDAHDDLVNKSSASENTVDFISATTTDINPNAHDFSGLQQFHQFDAAADSVICSTIGHFIDFDAHDERAVLSLHSPSKVLNESAGSVISVDISSTKKKIDESSHAFMEQLRGAANRRKNQVIQSRDSLRAKQMERKEAAFAIETATCLRENGLVNPSEISCTKPFKALPMPSASGAGQLGVPKVWKKPQTTPFSPLLGARRQKKTPLPRKYGAGQLGVPMVDKRPPTTPFSPLLGAKRRQKVFVPALKKPPPTLSRSENSAQDNPVKGRNSDVHIPQKENILHNLASFKARPLPSGFGKSGAGQVGIPKVSKRPPTIARSPMLGFRRKDSGTARNREVSDKSESSSQSLIGLDLLSPVGTGSDLCNLEKLPPVLFNTPEHPRGLSYVPHSTKRAQERAVYDRLRAENEAKNREQLKLAWKREIAAKRAEVAQLRNNL